MEDILAFAIYIFFFFCVQKKHPTSSSPKYAYNAAGSWAGLHRHHFSHHMSSFLSAVPNGLSNPSS